MAFGDNGTLNSNFLAGAFSQVITQQGIQISRQKNGLLYFMLGKQEPGSQSAMGGPKFANVDDDFSGNTVEWTLQTKPRLYTAVTDGANEFAAYAPSYDGNVIAGAKADVAHYPVAESVPVSEMRKLNGPAAKVKSWMQELFNYWILNYETTLGKAINGMTSGAHVETNQSQTALGSWTWPVSDSTDAAWAASTKTYGGIDRSIAANSDFSSTSAAPVSGTGKLALADYDLAQTRCTIRGANSLFVSLGETVWNITKALITAAAGYMATTVRDNRIDYSGQFFTYNGMQYVLDAYAPPQIAGILSPDSWQLKIDRINSFNMNEMKRNVGVKAIFTLMYDFFAALICMAPAQNYKIRGITS